MLSLLRVNTTLFAASWILVFSINDAPATTTREMPSRHDAARAEKILSKLEKLEADARDLHSYRAAVTKFYPSLFSEVAELGDGDLKTDLTTAVFLYENIYTSWNGRDAIVDCGDRLRKLYRELCGASDSAARHQFLLARARLHSRFAAAILRGSRGAFDAETAALLSEIRAERKQDVELAARAVGALKKVGSRVNAHSTLHEFEASGEVANVSFEKFSAELSTALDEVEHVLVQLPRSRLHRAVRNARNAFRSGASWWSKSSRAEQKVVAVNSLTDADPLKSIGLDARSVNYTVVSDWRKALRALEEAQAIIEELNSKNAVGNVGR